MSIQFDLPKDQSSIIKVIGVGGGGGNAVNHMFRQGIVGVNFVICNTDQQALEMSPVPNKIQLGLNLTEGRGAGMNPEIGKNSTLEASDQIKAVLQGDTKMVFITAGMGKGTGTGGAPVIAKIAREMGILTVGLVTTPFSAEGPKRFQQAQDGIAELKNHVDTLLIISNDKLREIYGNFALSAAFNQADNILTNAAKSIAEIITVPGYVNVDFEDVNTVMKSSGVAIMGTAIFDGEQRAINAVEAALSSPLLNDNDIKGARNILVNITTGSHEVTLDEVTDITEYVQREAGYDTNIIWGNCFNETLGEKLSVTIIATGFESSLQVRKDMSSQGKVTYSLESSRNEPQLKAAPILKSKPVAEEPEPVLKVTEVPFEIKSPATVLPPAAAVQAVIPMVAPEEEEETQNDFVLKEKSYSEASAEPEKLDLSKEAARDRISKLKTMSIKFQSNAALTEMEKEPAYKRRNINLSDVPHSSESNVSPYYINEPTEENKIPELKKNNSFLHGHDKVD